MMLDPVLTSIVVVSSYALWRWLRRRLEAKKPFDDLPMPPNSHWLLGHLPVLATRQFPVSSSFVYVDFADENGQVGIWLLNKRCISLLHAEHVRTVLMSTSDREFPSFAAKHFHMLAQHNLPALSGKEWKATRKMTNPLFKPEAINTFQANTKSVARTLSASLLASSSQEFNLLELMKMVTFDVLGGAAFSHDFKCCANLAVDPVVASLEYIKNSADSRVFNPLNPFLFFYSIPTKTNLKYHFHKRRVCEFIMSLVEDKRSKRSNGEKKDFLDNLLQENESIDDTSTFVDLMIVLIIAGYETTSTALCYAFYLLSLNPEAEQQCLEEICRCNGDYSLDKLQYCHAVVMEALRLYPSLPGTSRSASRDITLSTGQTIPKGTFVFLPFWFVQRSERHFPEPLRFCPDRWAKQGDDGVWTERTANDTTTHQIAPGNREAFFAFSGGGRSCPGARYALQEETLVLATLLKDIQIKVPKDYELKFTVSLVTQSPTGGIPVTVHARDA